tara:strand:- start:1290 stop:1691 length:402 start_codon:yes stop_codon:yes gene_type:complete
MELKSVTENDAKFLHELLEQREGRINISHKTIPTWNEHLEFVKNHDYLSWDIILVNNEKVGNIYLTNRNEIGIFIHKKFQSLGYGSDALVQFMKKNGKKRYLANINPTNYKSIQFFGKHGFTHVQNTYHKKFE